MGCPYRLLTQGESNPKLAKLPANVLAAGLHLYPARAHGLTLPKGDPVALAILRELGVSPAKAGTLPTLCPWAWQCDDGRCLAWAGRGPMAPVIRARVARVAWLFRDPPSFLEALDKDIAKLETRALAKGQEPRARLNCLSDLDWSRVYRAHPRVGFYEYTKAVHRVRRWLDGGLPPNLHLTLSRSERNEAQGLALVAQGATMTVVFRVPKGEPLPDSWQGFPVIDGDTSDARWLDPMGSIIGLRAKGALANHPEGQAFSVSPSSGGTLAPV